MAENLFKTEIEDIRLSAVLFDEAYSMKGGADPKWALSQLKDVHQHSTYEIFFIIDGCLSIITESDTVNCENAVAIIPPFVNHYTVAKNINGHCMYFSADRSAKHEGELFDTLEKGISEKVTVIPLTDDEKFYARHIEDALNGKLHPDGIPHLIFLLFSEIFSRFSEKNTVAPQSTGKQGKYITTIDVYIAAHYCENITLADLAAELYLCEKQISRIIRKGYGCSLSEVVNRRRLAVASMLLRYTNMPIKEIASNVGYEYENYFFTLFKKEYGTTPMQYREKNESKTKKSR